MYFTTYQIGSSSFFLSLQISLLMKFSMELMEPVSSAELLEKSAAPGLWLTARERCFRPLLMPRLSLAVLSSSILEGAQTHHFRSSAYCRKQVQTSLKQLCPTSTGKWATLQFTANHCAAKGSSIRKLTGDGIDEIPITSGDAVATWKIIFFHLWVLNTGPDTCNHHTLYCWIIPAVPRRQYLWSPVMSIN